MKYADQATPNHVLRQERELRGWSQNYVAEQLEAPSPSYISRWERGTAFPSPYYREKLCRLFGKNAQELGFLQTSSVATATMPMETEMPRLRTTVPLDEETLTLRGGTQYQPQPLRISAPPPPPLYTPGLLLPGGASNEVPERRPSFWLKRPLFAGLLLILLLASISTVTLLAIRQTITHAPTTPTRSWPTFAFTMHASKYETVRSIQLLLKARGFDIGKSGVDGTFGSDTEYAVRKFQEAHGLPITGIVERQTWEQLIVPSKFGDHGDFVLALQRQLNLASFHPRLQQDSEFGPLTQKAVRTFQQKNKLPATGLADLTTWCILVGGSLK